MPSGKTHDRLTLWLTPWVVGGCYVWTKEERLTLLMAIAFVFSGLMFGPDLDIQSVQYRRWGWLRWLWLPYRKLLRHRSFFSHGFLVGTTLRLLYLGLWLGAIAAVGLMILSVITQFWATAPPQWADVRVIEVKQWLSRWPDYRPEGIAVFIGLELGAMSHSVPDVVTSRWKRFKKWRSSSVSTAITAKKRKRAAKTAPRRR